MLKVNCPACESSVVWETANPYRPFCSQRCRLVDLHDWMHENYAVPAAATEGETASDGVTADEA